MIFVFMVSALYSRVQIVLAVAALRFCLFSARIRFLREPEFPALGEEGLAQLTPTIMHQGIPAMRVQGGMGKCRRPRGVPYNLLGMREGESKQWYVDTTPDVRKGCNIMVLNPQLRVQMEVNSVHENVRTVEN